MELKRVSSGKLRALGYDASMRALQVQFDDGKLLEYAGVSQETFRRLSGAASMWSFFRDNIEEEYTANRIR